MTSPQDQLVEARTARRVDEITAALERLSAAVEQDEDVTVILTRVCRQVVRAVPGTDLASITLMRDDIPYTATATGDTALRVGQAQYEAGEGPCLEAARTGQVQRAGVREAARRWPEFTAAARDAAAAGYLSAPLFVNSTYQGSLNLYNLHGDDFGTLDAALLELYTTAAEAGLRAARRRQDAATTIAQLRTALVSRGVIEQA